MKKLMKLPEVVVERLGELVDAVGVAEVGNPDPDHQQGHRDREQGVAESQGAGELVGAAVVAASPLWPGAWTR